MRTQGLGGQQPVECAEVHLVARPKCYAKLLVSSPCEVYTWFLVVSGLAVWLDSRTSSVVPVLEFHC